MRLGGPLFAEYDSPEQWCERLTEAGYTAAYCPVDIDASEDEIDAYRQAAESANITIAEVGAFGNNPIHPDPEQRDAAIEACANHLALADAIGAQCCVNVAGSRRSDAWAGPHPENLTDETFDMIVESVHEIVDRVDPIDTYYTLETMPWIYPDSTEHYRKLLDTIDRDHVAVHFDPVNLISSPQRYVGNVEVITTFVDELGPHIQSCHAKDVQLTDELTVRLEECRPGTGGLDYHTLLSELDTLTDVPVMLEHLPTEDEYRLAADYLRTVGDELGVTV